MRASMPSMSATASCSGKIARDQRVVRRDGVNARDLSADACSRTAQRHRRRCQLHRFEARAAAGARDGRTGRVAGGAGQAAIRSGALRRRQGRHGARCGRASRSPRRYRHWISASAAGPCSARWTARSRAATAIANSCSPPRRHEASAVISAPAAAARFRICRLTNIAHASAMNRGCADATGIRRRNCRRCNLRCPAHAPPRDVQGGEKRTARSPIGFHAAKSHTIVDMHECLVLTPALFGAVAAHLREMMGGDPER